MNTNLGIAAILVYLPSLYLVKLPRYRLFMVFIARCTIVQSVVLRLHVVRPSVCNVGGSGAHRLEILKNNCADN